jgi:hypothetical protein
VDDEDFQRLEEDRQIDDDGSIVNILHIKQYPLIIEDALATVDLPQTSDAG